MAQEKLTTAWMWLDGAEVRGLTIYPEEGAMRWYNTIGCHCTDEEYFEQTIAAYRHQGPPPYIGPLPDDITAEIEATLSHLPPLI